MIKLTIHIFYLERLPLSGILTLALFINVLVRIVIKIIRSSGITHSLQFAVKSVLTLPMISYAPCKYNWLILLCIYDHALKEGNSCKVKFNSPHKK